MLRRDEGRESKAQKKREGNTGAVMHRPRADRDLVDLQIPNELGDVQLFAEGFINCLAGLGGLCARLDEILEKKVRAKGQKHPELTPTAPRCAYLVEFHAPLLDHVA